PDGSRRVRGDPPPPRPRPRFVPGSGRPIWGRSGVGVVGDGTEGDSAGGELFTRGAFGAASRPHSRRARSRWRGGRRTPPLAGVSRTGRDGPKRRAGDGFHP